MLIKKTRISRIFNRKLKNRTVKICRSTNLYYFQCDNCGAEFTRISKQIKKSQLRIGVLHVCLCCQGPKFAAQASKLRRKSLKQDASSTLRIDYLR